MFFSGTPPVVLVQLGCGLQPPPSGPKGRQYIFLGVGEVIGQLRGNLLKIGIFL